MQSNAMSLSDNIRSQKGMGAFGSGPPKFLMH